MKRSILLAACILLVPGPAPLLAQWDAGSRPAPSPVSAGPGILQVSPLYQGWWIGENSSVAELSSMMTLAFPLSSSVGVTVRNAQAVTSGDPAAVRGLTDTQIDAGYRPEGSNFMLNLGVNVPSGVRELSVDEFQTSGMLSSPMFAFQVPSVGQGWNIRPGFFLAIPANPGLALGFGVSYQIKGAFKPVGGMADYAPGNELLLTGGLDGRVASSVTASADLVLTLYGRDKIGDREAYAAGSRTVLNMQLHMLTPPSPEGGLFLPWQKELTLGVQYRSKSKSQFVVGNVFIDDDQQLEPSQLYLYGNYRTGFNDHLTIGTLVFGKFFEDSHTTLAAHHIYGLGLFPEFLLSARVAVPVQLTYQFGSLRNGSGLHAFEFGAGLTLVL